MGRGKKDSPEDWKRYKKLEQENEKLKREVTKLRKLVNVNCIDQLEEREERVKENKRRGVDIEPIELGCQNCGKTEFKIISFKRIDGEFEIKVCAVCSHRGDLKKIKGKEKDDKRNTKDSEQRPVEPGQD
jgi:hypothetical protein